MAAQEGFEPALSESESDALPLGYWAISNCLIIIANYFYKLNTF